MLNRVRLNWSVVGSCLLLVVGPINAGATTIGWSNLAGTAPLEFSDGANWVGGGAPGASDQALFNLGAGTQTLSAPVLLTTDVEVQAVGILSGQVEFDLDGNILTATSPNGALQIFPNLAGDAPSLVLSNSDAVTPAIFRTLNSAIELQGGGALTISGSGVSTESARVAVGVASPLPLPATTGSPSLLTVSGGTLSAVSRIDIGASEDGEFILESGGQVSQLTNSSGNTGLGVYIGDATGIVGNAIVRDAGTLLTSKGVVIGGRGTGSLALENGAGIEATDSVLVGVVSGGTGSLSISGAGTTLTAPTLSVGGYNSDGDLTISGGTVDVDRLYASYTGRSALEISGGQVSVSERMYVNTGSTFVLGGQLDLSLTKGYSYYRNAIFRDGLELASGSQVNLNAGSLETTSITESSGEFNWNGGSVTLSESDLNVGQGALLGSEIELRSGSGFQNALRISGALTIDGDQTADPLAAGGGVTIESGGSLSAGSINLVNNGNFSWNDGSLALTNSDLEIEVGGLVGDQVILNTTRSLSVSGTTNLASGSTLTLDGGTFRTSTLTGPAGFTWNSGTLDVDEIHSGTSTNAIGPVFEVGTNRRLFVDNLHADDGILRLTGGQIIVQSSLQIDDLQGGRFDFESGRLTMIGNASVGTAGITGSGGSSSVTLASGDSVHITGQLEIDSGSSVELAGGSLRANLGWNGAVNFESGDVFANSILVGPGGLLGVGSSTDVVVSEFSSVTANGVLDVTAGHSLEVAGGSVSFVGLTGEGLTFSSGTLISTLLTIGTGGVLGASGSSEVNLASGDYMLATSDTVIEAAHSLVVDGGTFTTDRLDVNAGGSFDLQTGSFNLLDQDLYIGSSYSNPSGFKLESNTASGSYYSINTGATIYVGSGRTTFVDSSGLEIQAGGTLSTWELNAPQFVTGPGLLDVRHTLITVDTLFDSNLVGELVDIGAALTLGSNAAIFADAAIAPGASMIMQSGSTMEGEASIDAGGSLSGTGLITGGITNGGVVSPGQSPGQLNVNGFYDQLASGNLVIEIGRDDTTQQIVHDALSVTGIVTLGGSLELVTDTVSDGLDASFDPSTLGSFSYTLLAGSDIEGQFDSIIGGVLGNNLQWVIEYFNDRVDVSLSSVYSSSTIDHRTLGAPAPVPEPGTLPLIMFGLIALAWHRKQGADVVR